MRYQKSLSLGFLLVCLAAVNAQTEAIKQHPPLIAEANRTVPLTRSGGAQSFQITSAILRETRRILIRLPESYAQSAPGRRYPVTVVVDGDFLLAPVAIASDELSRNGQIPESVIVGIENFGGADPLAANTKRVNDLTPPGLSVSGSGLNEGGDRFLDFIENEVLPAVDAQFKTAAPRAFVGVSSGGILATYAAATRSTYRTVISLDAPIQFDDNWLAKKLLARAAAPLVPLRYVSLEARFGWPDQAWNALVAAAPANWKLHRESFRPHESHDTLYLIGAYVGLREAFSDYSMLAAPPSPTSAILPYYAALNTSFGAALVPPKKLLEQLLTASISEAQAATARQVYDLLNSGYGPPPESASLLARIARLGHQPAPVETIEGLLATPFPTPDEARAFVGEWVGDVWMGPDEPRHGQILLRLKVVDGHLVGETVHRDAPGGGLVVPWTYLRMTPCGMSWGFMNGMRPRAVAIFDGTLTGDTLTGTMRFGGVTFSADEAPPPLHFSFKRVAPKAG
jgi:hypothetical protein